MIIVKKKLSSKKILILTKAKELMKRNNISDITVDKICKITGVPRGTVLYQFKSREDIFLSLYDFELNSLKVDFIEYLKRYNKIDKYSYKLYLKKCFDKVIVGDRTFLLLVTSISSLFTKDLSFEQKNDFLVSKSSFLEEIYNRLKALGLDIDLDEHINNFNTITTQLIGTIMLDYTPFKVNFEVIKENTSKYELLIEKALNNINYK